MSEILDVLSNYVPELMTMTIGGISIGTVVYLVKFIAKELKKLRTDPAVEAIKKQNKEIIEINRILLAENEELKNQLKSVCDDIHHIYREG